MEFPSPIPQDGPLAPYGGPAVPTLPEDPVWNLWDVLLLAIFGLVSQFILAALAIGVAHSMSRFHGATPAALANNALVLVPAQMVAYLLLVAFMGQIVKFKYRADFVRALRWNMPAFPTATLALAGGAGFAFLSEVISALLSKWTPKTTPIDELFRDRNSAFVLAFFGVLVAPLVEELFFRGFLYPALARTMGITSAVLLTSLPFALLHSPQLAHAWVPLMIILLFSILLTIIRARTKSLAMTVLMHAGYNATLFTTLFIATQGFRHMERG